MEMKTTKYRAPLCSILPCDDGGTFPLSVAASSTCALCRMCAHSTGWGSKQHLCECNARDSAIMFHIFIQEETQAGAV
jgi:hypothetical protein